MASFERRVPIFITFEGVAVVVGGVVSAAAVCVDAMVEVGSGAIEDETRGYAKG